MPEQTAVDGWASCEVNRPSRGTCHFPPDGHTAASVPDSAPQKPQGGSWQEAWDGIVW